jgi:hypothetical protein
MPIRTIKSKQPATDAKLAINITSGANPGLSPTNSVVLAIIVDDDDDDTNALEESDVENVSVGIVDCNGVSATLGKVIGGLRSRAQITHRCIAYREVVLVSTVKLIAVQDRSIQRPCIGGATCCKGGKEVNKNENQMII